jgi:hypothetical protein
LLSLFALLRGSLLMPFRIDRIVAAWALLIWGVLLTVIAVHGCLYPRSHTVYDIYGRAARNWWAGRDLYAPIVKEWWEEPGVRVQTTDYYRYCPLFAIGVTPFAALPDQVGNPLWKMFASVFFAAGFWTAGRRLFSAALNRTELGLLFLFALPIAAQSMYIGQANLIVVGGVLLGLSAAAENRWNRAAGWLALVTLIKGYPLALGLLLAALYPRRFVVRFVGALALGLLLPFAAQRPQVVLDQTLNWWTHLRASTVLMRERLRSVDKLLEVCQLPISAQAFALLGLGAGVVVLGLCLLSVRQDTNQRLRLTWMLNMFSIWVVLFGPATEACTYVVMSPVVAWALLDAWRRGSGWLFGTLLVVSLCMMGPMATDMFGASVRVFANAYAIQPAGAILFFGVLLAERARRLRVSAPTAETATIIWGRAHVQLDPIRTAPAGKSSVSCLS